MFTYMSFYGTFDYLSILRKNINITESKAKVLDLKQLPNKKELPKDFIKWTPKQTLNPRILTESPIKS